MHDALKRRCLYHWIEYPDYQTELRIVQLKVPGISIELTNQLISAVQYLRQVDLFKPPGVAETLDWGNALIAMDRKQLNEETLSDTLGVLLKYQDDVQRVEAELLGDLLNVGNANG